LQKSVATREDKIRYWLITRQVVCTLFFMNEVLQQVRDYADKAHGNQQRKYSPERYIVHPVRVMELCEKYDNRLPVLAASLLHDVLEDTAVTPRELHAFLLTVMSEEDSKQTALLVKELTDVYTKQEFPRWNRRKRKRKESARIEKTGGDSQTIKYADIIDNSREIAQHDPDFATVFLTECWELLGKMPKGNAELYQQAKHVVQTELEKVRPRRHEGTKDLEKEPRRQ
jgi:guanosine-3',5'-bis(diphosphate) 3'-pyrophosphohydrolase